MPTNVHKFYILTRQPSPVGETSTTTTTRRSITKGETKKGTTPMLNYDSTTDLVTETPQDREKVKLNPGDLKEETLQGATIRWTITHTGIEHTVAEVITIKELEILKTFPAGLGAYNTISANIDYTPAPEDLAYSSTTPVQATIDVVDFHNMIALSDKTQLSRLFDIVKYRDLAGIEWEDDPARTAVDTFARNNLPSGVTIS